MRYFFRYLTPVFLLLLITPVWPDQLIIEPDMGRAPILNAINHATHSIDLVMYGFTDQPFLSALIQKKSTGNIIKIFLEAHPYQADDENTQTIAALNQNHFAWQGSIPNTQLIHEKVLIIDDHEAIVMTFNFTRSTFTKERNFALIINDPARTQQITHTFAADWNHLTPNATTANVIISPDHSRDKIIALIQQAQHDIKIYAQSLNDYQIIGALAQAAKNNINIEILTSAKLRKKQAAYLERAGVNIRYSKQWIIHAKAWLFDQQTALIGSTNLTRASLDDNRELSVVTQDVGVINQLNKTFDADWS